MEILSRLADRSHREAAAKELASSVGATDLVILAREPGRGVFVAAPGFLLPATRWDEICRLARDAGTHESAARDTAEGDEAPVVVTSDGELAMAFVGGAPDREAIEALAPMHGVLRPLFEAELREREARRRVELAEAVAHRANDLAGALESARAELAVLYERERTARDDAETLFRITEELNNPDLDIDALMQRVTDEATASTGAAFGAFFSNVVDDETGESYQLYTLSGLPREAFDRFGMPRNTLMFGATFKGAGVVRVDDVLEDPRYGKNPPHYGIPAGHPPVRSYLAVPVITTDGEVTGGLFFGHPEPGRFTEEHEQKVKALAASAAVATSRLRAEATIRARQLQLHLISDNLPTLVALLDDERRYRFANATYARWFGIDPADCIGRRPEEVFGEETASRVRPYLERALRGEDGQVTFEMTRDGVTRYLESRLVPARNGGREISGVVALATDVTARVRREAKERLIANATSLLLHSREIEPMLSELAELVVGELCDWCILHLEDEGPTPTRVIRHRDQTRQELVEAQRVTRPWSPLMDRRPSLSRKDFSRTSRSSISASP